MIAVSRLRKRVKSCPELRCKLHGRTDNDRGDADLNTALAAYFNLVSAQSTQDELARLRAMACKDELVARGVPDERLLVTWAGRGKFSTVDFFAMERAKASTEETAWGREAATRTLKCFDDELKQKDIHFDYDSTNMAELAWRSWHVEDPAKRALNSRMIKEMTEQAWSIESLDPSKAALNSKALDVVANTLKSYPELRCELRGSTDADPASPPNKVLAAYFNRKSTGVLKSSQSTRTDTTLAAYFQLESAHSIQEKLAEQRATACMDALVKRGVPAERLLVTWEAYGEQSKVDFLPMDKDKKVAVKNRWDARREKDPEELEEEREKQQKAKARLKQLQRREELENALAKKHIQFDCASPSVMQQQAYSIKSQEGDKATSNSKILKLVAKTLKSCPELHCKLHCRSTSADLGDGDLNEGLAKHFGLKSKLSIHDELARLRAMACKEALVARRVPSKQLFVTWAGRGEQSKLEICLMEPVEASAEKAAWEGKAAARARKRFENELEKRHIQFDCASTATAPGMLKDVRLKNMRRFVGGGFDKPKRLAVMKTLLQAHILKEATKQAWSLTPQYVSKPSWYTSRTDVNVSMANSNLETLELVAYMLHYNPELHCKLHGSTDSERGDSDKNKALSAYFKRESTMQIQDELAQKRANACRNELVKLGIDKERLLVTWVSCGEHSKVEFFPMESAEASAEKAIWKSKAAEAVNIFKSTVNDPISEIEHTVDRLRAKTCD